MKNALGILLIFVTFFNTSVGQNNNGWINKSQNYIKIVIDSEGLYKLDFIELKKAGIDLEKSNLSLLQLFYRGKELGLGVREIKDNKIDENDFIFFYGIKNDGELDNEVYLPKNSKPSNHFNLYNDDAAYFLTIGKIAGKRIFLNSFNQDLNLEKEKNYRGFIFKAYTEDWNFDYRKSFYPTLQQSFFEKEELLCSKFFAMNDTTSNNAYTEKINLKNIDLSSDEALQIETLFCSRRPTNKELLLTINSKTFPILLNGFSFAKNMFDIGKVFTDQVELKSLIYKSSGKTDLINDRFSIGYYKLQYPKLFNYEEAQNITIKPNIVNQSLIEIPNSEKKLYAFDISDFYDIQELETNFNSEKKLNTFIANNTKQSKNLFLSADFKKPKSLITKKFEENLTETPNYIIITHNKLKESSEKYAEYRRSKIGGGYSVEIKYIDDIYDEYLFGFKNPAAIRKYINYNFKNKNNVQILLFGSAFSYTSLISSNNNVDLVPSIGFPASDFILTLDEDNFNRSICPIGRIPATENSEGSSYLNKVIDFELENSNNLNFNWKKNILQLSGGKEDSEISSFKDFMSGLGDSFRKSILGAAYQIKSKTSTSQPVEDVDISNEINNGISVVNFFGHSSATKTDLNIGFASDASSNFNNKPKFPFMMFNGCGAGNIFENQQALTRDWLMTPSKGAIGILAHSYLSFSYSNMNYMQKFYSKWFSSTDNLTKSIGEVIYLTNNDILSKNTEIDKLSSYEIANVHQMVLQGDPALKIFNFQKPDFQITDNDIFLSSTNLSKSITDNDEINLGLITRNSGIYEINNKSNLKITKGWKDGSTSTENVNLASIVNIDTINVKLKKDKNLVSMTFELDFDKKIDEINESNNVATLNFNWDLLNSTNFYSTALSVDVVNPTLSIKIDGKLPYDGIQTGTEPVFNINLTDNLDLGDKTDKLEVSLLKICQNCNDTPNKIELKNIGGNSNEIISNLKLSPLKAGNYQIFIQGYDAKKNPSGQVYSLIFNVVEDTDTNESYTIKVFPNPMTLFTQFEISNFSPNNKSYLIDIYNEIGLKIKTISGSILNNKSIIYWDGSNNENIKSNPGHYIYNINIENSSKSGRIVVSN